MEYVVAALLLALLIALVLWSRWFRPQDETPEAAGRPLAAQEPCPLCGHPLKKGERVHSVKYKSSLDDQEMDIHGCPYCYPEHPQGFRARGGLANPRRCLVCKKPLETGEVAWARVFQRPGRKLHVHVLGCLRCRR